MEGQEKDIRAWMELTHPDWKLVRLFRDRGFSASTTERPALQTMMALAAQGSFDTVICWRFDRLARDNVDFPVLLHYLRKNGVAVVSMSEPSPDYDTPYGEFVVGMIGLISTMERRVIQARVKMGMKTRAQKGLWHGGIPTYGYKYDRTAGKIVRHPGEPEVVRLIFGKYLELKSCFKVRDYLNELGSRKRDSSKWDVLRIRNVLRRRVHAGWLISSGVEVFDTSLQMVPEETFVAVQKLLTEERTCPDPLEVIAQSGGVLRVMQHQFSNKAEYEACPECGRRSTVKRQGKSRKGLLIFNCVACERWFIEGLGSSPIPPCPICLKTSNVQRGRRFISDARIPFRTYWCRGCGARFRVQDHLNTNS